VPEDGRPIGESEFHGLTRSRVRIIFGSILGAIFLSALDQTVVATALPQIIAQFGALSQYTFVATAYLITSVVVIPIVGRLIDLFGRKWFYIGGIGIFVGGSLLCGLSQSIWELIAFRALQGVGAGVMLANAFTIIGDLFPPAVRGKYQSFISIVFGLSAIIGPLVGGFLTDTLGWPWIFFVNVPLGAGIILLFIRYLPFRRPDRVGKTVDSLGILLVVLSVVPALAALSLAGSTSPWGSVPILAMLSSSAVAVAVFVLYERGRAQSIIPLALYRNRVIVVSLAASFLLGFSMYAVIIFLPLWFQGVAGESATASGSYLTPMMLGNVAGAFLSGQALARIGGHYRRQGIVGIFLLMIGWWLLTTLVPSTSHGLAVFYMTLGGFGLGITMPLYSTAVQNVVSRRQMGSAISAVPFWRFTGAAFGLSVLGNTLSSRFAAGFLSLLPDSITQVIPTEQLTALARDPQGLISGRGRELLKGLLTQSVAHPDQAYQDVMRAMLQALNSAVTHVLFLGFIAAVVAFIVHLAIKEVPLRKGHEQEPPDMV
jgi:EmrB/QacA subfamily drug resistance transporter